MKMEAYKSSVDKFYSQEDLAQWAHATKANRWRSYLVMAGGTIQHEHSYLPYVWN